MASESEVIQKLRYQVDNYDEQQELLQGLKQSSNNVASNPHHHVQLCAPDTNKTTVNAYSITLCREHGITDFPQLLSSFFKQANWEPDVCSYDVGLNLRYLYLLCWQIRSFLITHVESPMTVKRLDQNKQIFFAQPIPGEMKVHGMTVSLSKDGQDQVFSLPGCLASSQLPTVTRPMV